MEATEGSGKRYPLWLRFHAWFFGLSAIYWTLALFGVAYMMGIPLTGTVGHVGTFIGNFIGLFVPVGPTNFFFLFLPNGLIALVLILAALFFGERTLRKGPQETTFHKIVLNLIILLMLTFITDMIMFGHWASFWVFMGNGPV